MGIFLFVTANLHEKNAFERYFKRHSEKCFRGKTYYHGSFGNYNVVYIHINEQGVHNPASMPLVSGLIQKLKPVAVVMVGIAFGANEKKQKIGDVLVSKYILPYDSLKFLEKSTQYKEIPKEVGFQLLNAFSNSDSWEYDLKDSNKSTVFVGAMLTGSRLINNYEYRTKLLADFKKYKPIGGEMEAYGIYSGCKLNGVLEWIIVKGICDWGYKKNNPNKENYQKTAAHAAVNYCLHVFSRPGVFDELVNENGTTNRGDDIEGENDQYKKTQSSNKGEHIDNKGYLHKKTLNDLGGYFNKTCISSKDFKTWGKIFYQISSIDININLQKDSYIDDLFKIINSDGNIILNITGNLGTGISPCLSALYHFFYEKYQKNQSMYYPIYIDFGKYRKKIYKGKSDLLKQAKNFAHSQMTDTLSFLKKHNIKSILLIFDGVDHDSKFQKPLEEEIVTIFESFSKKKIIGSIYYFRNKEKGKNANVTFSPINVENAKFNEIVTQLCILEGKTENVDLIKKFVKKSNFNTIDFFLLQFVCKNSKHTLEDNDILSLLENFCLEHLNNQGIKMSINDASKFAFDYGIKGEIFKENQLNNPAWSLYNQNKEIQHFLIAKYVVHSLLFTKDFKKSDFNFIYPDRIDFYRIILINKNIQVQNSIFKTTKEILTKNKSYNAHANALFLLGRLNYEVIKEDAKKIIYDYQKKHEKLLVENKELLLALRASYISLAYLGDEKASKIYIGKLLSCDAWNRINRGFHLRYYGDINYFPRIGLITEDNLEDFPKTYSYLYNKISSFVRTPLFDVEVYTFFSLIQSRHKVGRFNNREKLDGIINLIDKILKKDIVEYTDLKFYLEWLKEIFNKPTFSHFTLLRQINNIKFEKRKRWVHLGFKEIEVVAAHTLNAFLMASLSLPDKGDEPEYDKSKIMDMLLYHDLAECVIHNHLPSEKTDVVKTEERNFYEKLSLYKTYGFFNTKKICDLWNEFRMGASINSIIAKEIDKLEAYAQFLSYLASGEKIKKDDFKEWCAKINNIKTRYGIEIKRYIESEFKSIIEKYSSS